MCKQIDNLKLGFNKLPAKQAQNPDIFRLILAIRKHVFNRYKESVAKNLEKKCQGT